MPGDLLYMNSLGALSHSCMFILSSQYSFYSFDKQGVLACLGKWFIDSSVSCVDSFSIYSTYSKYFRSSNISFLITFFVINIQLCNVLIDIVSFYEFKKNEECFPLPLHILPLIVIRIH